MLQRGPIVGLECGGGLLRERGQVTHRVHDIGITAVKALSQAGVDRMRLLGSIAPGEKRGLSPSFDRLHAWRTAAEVHQHQPLLPLRDSVLKAGRDAEAELGIERLLRSIGDLETKEIRDRSHRCDHDGR